MVQIIKEFRQPSFGEKLGQAFGQGSEAFMNEFLKMKEQQQEKQRLSGLTSQEDEAIKRFGIDITGIQDPDLRRQIVVESLKGQGNGPSAEQLKQQEKQQGLLGAKDALSRMRDIKSRGNLGVLSGATKFLSQETAKDVGEYEQLGKSLIQYATNIPIRNQMEFQTLADKLYDASTLDSEKEGILNAMERIINDALGVETEEKQAPEVKKKVKKPKKTSFFQGMSQSFGGQKPSIEEFYQ